MLYLTCTAIEHGSAEGERYPIEERADLVEAVEAEAEKIAADAGSDLLLAPTEAERKKLCKRETQRMLANLWRAGDACTTADGMRWFLLETNPTP